MAAVKQLEEFAGVDYIQRISNRGRKFGQKISTKQMKKIEVFLDKLGVKLEMHPKTGTHIIDGYFVANQTPAKLPDSAAAMFITNGIDMKIVLREETTYYEFLHEFMHFMHSKSMELKNYFKLGGYGSKGELAKEMWVFEKMLEYQNFITKAELKHALNYINRVRKRFGQDPLEFDFSNIPEVRKEISIENISNTKLDDNKRKV